jgi:hypothetical protein
MTSINATEAHIRQLLCVAFSANARFRSEASKLEEVLCGQNIGIQDLLEHVARVENHSENIKKLYESSISWKVTAPLRSFARIISKIVPS